MSSILLMAVLAAVGPMPQANTTSLDSFGLGVLNAPRPTYCESFNYEGLITHEWGGGSVSCFGDESGGICVDLDTDGSWSESNPCQSSHK